MSPRTPDEFAALREESAGRILEAALRLFARHGYAATPVRRIAEEADVAQGLMYNYFRGKADLLRAIFERSLADVDAAFREAAGGATPAERLERLIRASFAVVERHRDFCRLSYSLRMQEAVLEGLLERGRWTESIRGHLEAALAEAGAEEAATESRVLFGLIDGVAQHYVMDPEDYPLAEVTERIVARYAGSAGPG